MSIDQRLDHSLIDKRRRGAWGVAHWATMLSRLNDPFRLVRSSPKPQVGFEMSGLEAR